MPVSNKKILHELKDIKKADKKIAKQFNIIQASESQMKAFFDFIRSQGVVGLAVGLVLGGAVSVMVRSLIDNVVMPPLGLLMGSADGLKGLAWVMGYTSKSQPVVLHYGIFLNDFINFIIIALVIYLIIHLLKADKFDNKKE